MDEKQFLIFLAVGAYNTQYGMHYRPEEFDCIKIPNGNYQRCAFEIYTKTETDYLRLRLYCQFGTSSRVGTYQLNVSEPAIDLGLGDEVYVADAILDQEFLYSGNNYIRQSCPEVVADPSSYMVIGTEDGYALLTEDGFEILL